MSGLNKSNKGFFERENMSRTWFWVPLSLLLLQKRFPVYKVLSNEHPRYIFNLFPVRQRTFYSTKNILIIALLDTNHNLLSSIPEWNKLDPGLRKAESLLLFKTYMVKFILLSPNSVYNCHNPKGLKFLNSFYTVPNFLIEDTLSWVL